MFQIGTTPTRRPKNRKRDAQSGFLDICIKALKATSQLSEFDAVGINVGKKLAKMDAIQALYAESLINDVLRKGVLKQLTEESSVCDGGCKYAASVYSPPSVSSFTSVTHASTSKCIPADKEPAHDETQKSLN